MGYKCTGRDAGSPHSSLSGHHLRGRGDAKTLRIIPAPERKQTLNWPLFSPIDDGIEAEKGRHLIREASACLDALLTYTSSLSCSRI